MSKTRERMCYYQPWGSIEDGRIEFETLTDETLQGALDVIRKSFCVHESVCKAVELMSEPGASEELIELCLNAAKDGVTVVAIDIITNEVVGVCFNKLQVYSDSSEKSFFEQFRDNCKYESSKYLMNLMIDVDSRINLFKHYNVHCILELMFLATLPAYGKRGIGESLIASSLALGKELRRDKIKKIPITINGNNELTNADKVPTLASAIMTSSYSQRIATKLHFNQLIEVSYDEFEFNGKKFSEKLEKEKQKKCTLVAKIIHAV
ncbi:uncharacterized protein LOC114929870 isoform X2 [Nylanderia fulva]|uniref:uncharacterized protein LOC114929870 isoform X2 n=1 Tax=Nylanderia fulva TaxID=613905 RepID=UPI0010FAE064|nr:uncharacterized protein LOC114929870 isoform X2 [Nylanderia fulva]